MARLVKEENAGDCGPPGRRDEWNFDMTNPQTGRSEAIVGPFTLRETVIGGSVLVILIGSVLPFFEAMGRFGNLWNSSSLFFLAIGIVLPIVTAGLITARRLGTDIRIGSLSVDQFASVVAVLATAFFFLQTVTSFRVGPFICLLGAIGMLAATVGGPHLPRFSADFAHRPSAQAHVMARPVLPAIPKAPKAPKTETSQQPDSAEEVTQWTDGSGTTTSANASPAGAAAVAGSAAAGSRVAGSPAAVSRPETQKKSASGTVRSRLGFGAARATSANTSQGTPDAHLDSSVAAVPGVQDKELPDDDSSAYPRFADEDFAPYANSADSAKSPDSISSTESVSSPESATAAKSAQSTDAAELASPETTDRTGEDDAEPSVPTAQDSAARDSSDSDSGQEGQQNAENYAGQKSGDDSATGVTDQASTNTGQQDTVSGRGAATAITGASAAAATTAQPIVEHHGSGAQESISATKSEDEGPVVEAFWFAVGTPRPVVDEASGVELFVLRPGDWEVGIEDRGEEFLVQDKRTGRVGVMRDLTNIERAPSDG